MHVNSCLRDQGERPGRFEYDRDGCRGQRGLGPRHHGAAAGHAAASSARSGPQTRPGRDLPGQSQCLET